MKQYPEDEAYAMARQGCFMEQHLNEDGTVFYTEIGYRPPGYGMCLFCHRQVYTRTPNGLRCMNCGGMRHDF